MIERNLPPLLDAAGNFPPERRETLQKLFANEVFGVSPQYEGPVAARLLRRETCGNFGSKEVVELTLTTPKGLYTYPIYVYFPREAAAGHPVPLVLYVGNRPRKDTPMGLPPGMTLQKMAKVIGPAMGALPGGGAFAAGDQMPQAVTRGCNLDDALALDNWPVEMLLRRGFATAAYYTEDLEPDHCTDGREGIICHYDDANVKAPERWGAIAAWAFGASRALDYLTQDVRISRDVAVAGHSRGGKTALWCAANDPRVTCCYANNSGCTGAALSRGKRGEGVLQINSLFPYWFCDNYKKYNGREGELPVDQHMLLALIAPRLLYLASATEDFWSDPQSEFDGAAAADAAYRAMGVQGLACTEMPRPGAPSHEGHIGYHVRAGGHALTKEDWQLFCDFWQAHL